MKTIQLKLGKRSYAIDIGKNILGKELKHVFADEIAIVTDSKVSKLPWFPKIETTLKKKAKLRFLRLTVPAGEQSKNLHVYGELCSKLAKNNFSRKTLIIAVGGGVIGDLAGFVAATYLRGVRLVQIPTSLLATVDSSVGGKTAVDIPEGKNLIGAFFQPERVLIDTALLATLPKRQWNAGMAEVIKYALIRDHNLWETLWNSIVLKQKLPLEDVITRCVEIKAGIVGRDEKDTKGERALLNFGHTIGHAIEQVTGYDTYLHGEAISIGMVEAAKLSEKILGLESESTQKIRAILKAQHLPVEMPADLDKKKLLQAIVRDKKSTGKNIQWILLPRIGKAQAVEKTPGIFG